MGSAWVDPLLFALATLGGGGLLLALQLGYAANRRTVAARAVHCALGLTSLASGVFALLAWASGQPLAIWASPALVIGLCLVLVAGPRVSRSGTTLVRLAHHRYGRSACAAGICIACPFFALGLVSFSIEGPALLVDDELAILAAADVPGALPKRNTDSPLRTDRGRLVVTIYDLPGFLDTPTPELLAAQRRFVELRGLLAEVIQLPGWANCNCHGFVFTDGRYSIGGAQVDGILSDNGYQPVDQVQVGDVAVYRGRDGEVLHTGLVCGVSADGSVLVESKWGRFGRFIHPHDRHIYSETECTFYRSARAGHLLAGVVAEAGPALPALDAGDICGNDY